jgi:molybdopterin converting factor small subunit
MITLEIEFFGVPRQRAGTARTALSLPGEQARLADALYQLARTLPGFAACCVDGQRLCPAYIVNVGGERFVTDPDFVLHSGDALLIMSADAGG